MSAQHPITPPTELMARLWRELSAGRGDASTGEIFNAGVRTAYAAGADAQLERCCQWLEDIAYRQSLHLRGSHLQAAMRPKPPITKAEALGALSRADKDALTSPLTGEVVAWRTILSKEQADTIRHALEALPDE